MKTALLASALAVVTAAGAHAATVLNDGSFEFQNGSLTSGASVQFDYSPSTDLVISDISISGTGFSNGTDLANLTFEVNGVVHNFDTITPNVGTSSASGVIPGFTTNTDFSVLITNTASVLPVQFTFTFVASEAQVPLPAAGGLLAVALLAGAAATRKGKKD